MNWIRKRGNFKLETSNNDNCNECKSSPIRCYISTYQGIFEVSEKKFKSVKKKSLKVKKSEIIIVHLSILWINAISHATIKQHFYEKWMWFCMIDFQHELFLINILTRHREVICDMVAIRLYWTLLMPIFKVILQTRVLIGCLAQGAFLIG